MLRLIRRTSLWQINLADRFTIFDDGETVVWGEWEPPLEDLEARLIGLSNYIEDSYPVMASMEQVIRESTVRHFEEKTDPSGSPWKEVSDKYAQWKMTQGYDPADTLVLSGKGRDAAISESAYMVELDSISFVPDELPEYMPMHQTGGEKLPQRQFIGLSDEDEAKIVAIYNTWIAAGIEMEFPSEGLGGLGFNMLGAFPIISQYRSQPIVRTSSGPRFAKK